jgi:threonine synthase
MATAHPAKFPEIVEAAIGREVPIPPGLVGDENAREEMQEMAPTLDALRDVLESRAR